MKKIIFLLAIAFIASFSFLNAQNFTAKNPEPTATVPGKCDPHEYTKADAVLKYITGNPTVALGTSTAAAGTHYTSGCINFTKAQMGNYVGATLHQINVGVAPSGSMLNLTGYKIWIKTALDGPIVYQQTVTPVLNTAYHWEEYILTTPYIITDNALVIGFTATWTGTTHYPLACTNDPPDTYKPGGFNYINAVNSATQHEAGAVWNQYTTAGNLAIEALVTDVDPLPTNDLAASYLLSYPLKWVGKQAPFTVNVFNPGSASQNNYTVQIIDPADAVLSTTQVTQTINSGTDVNIVLNYTPTTAGSLSVRGKVILAGDEKPGNDICDPITQKVYPMQPMAYCDNSDVTGVGGGAAITHQAAIGYPIPLMGPYMYKKLTAIELAFGVPVSTINPATSIIWIRNSLTGTNLYQQNFTPIDGWNTVVLDTPYELGNENIYIGWTATSTQNYIIGCTGNAPRDDANGGHIQFGTGAWTSMALNSLAYNNAIIGVIEASTTPLVNITTDVTPAGTGTVTGANVYAVGATVTLTAKPAQGYQFVKWTDNNTSNPRTFNASADETYTAMFEEKDCDDVISGTGVVAVYQYPVNMYYGNSYVQELFSAAELGNQTVDKYISSIKFQHLDAATISKPDVKIYLANTNKATFGGITTSEWIPGAELQLVYSGPVTFTANSEIQIDFNQPLPFKYKAGSGLVVAIVSQNANVYYNMNTRYRATTTTNYTTLQYYADGVTININAPPAPSARVLNHNNFTFEFCPIPPVCDDYEIAPETIANYWIPINCYYGNNYTQMIYDANEIGDFIGNSTITSLSLECLRTITRDNVTVYLGNTTKTTFANNTDWIPLSQLEEVFQGQVNLAPGALEFPITPFTYTGGNLVVAFLNNQGNAGDGTTNTFNVHDTPNLDKCINYYVDGATPINPATPPTANGTQNFPKRRANISFNICGFPAFLDMEAVSITGNLLVNEGETQNYTVTVKNNSEIPKNNFTVRILTEAGTQLATTTIATALDPGQSTQIQLPITFTNVMVGNIKIKGQVVLAKDMNPDNDETSLFSIAVVDKCALVKPVDIGNGTTTNYYVPVNTYYNYSYSQQIFDASELNLSEGDDIISVAFQYIYSAGQIKPNQSVYIGNTTQSTFASTSAFIPLNQMTLVYSGPIDFNNSQKWSTVYFDTPFTYTGGNLVVAVQNNHGAYVTSSNATFQVHTATSKAVMYYRDTSPIDITAPMTGSPTASVPAYRNNVQFNGLEIKQYELNIGNVIGAGVEITLTPNPILCGGDGMITISLNDDCKYIQNVIIGGQNMGSITSYPLTNVTEPLPVIEVVTGHYQYEIVASHGPNGTISPDGTSSSACGTQQIFNIQPDPGYTLESLIYNGQNMNVPSVTKIWTTPAIMENGTLYVTFKECPFFINVDIQGDGTVALVVGTDEIQVPPGLLGVDEGVMYQFKFYPGTGADLTGVYVDYILQPFAVVTQSYMFMPIYADHILKVVFELQNMNIFASAGQGGKIYPSGNIAVPYGNDQNFTFAPNMGYVIDKVFVDNVENPSAAMAGEYEFVQVKENHTIYVTFKPAELIIHMEWTEGGSLYPTGNTYTPTGAYTGDVYVTYNATQIITFTPQTGYKIASLVVNGVSYPQYIPTGSYTFYYITTENWITVTFEKLQFAVTAKADQHSVISPEGTSMVPYGNNKIYTFYALNGYHLSNVFVDGIGNAPAVENGTYTFEDVTGNHTIDVVTAINTYTIGAVAHEGGLITPNGNTTVNWGANQAYNITPYPGYKIISVLVDGVENGEAVTTGSYAFINVKEDHTIEVFFEITRFSIAATAAGNGIINPAGITELNYGEDVTFTITPDEGYKISFVLVNGNNIGDVTTYTFYKVEGDGTIDAFFEKIVIIDPNGIVDPLAGISVYSHTNNVYIKNSNLVPVQDVSIFDMYGRVVWQGNVYKEQNTITLNVANGIYTVRIATEENFVTTKVTILR